jgi:inosine-uridine nucleoside N-ribohydrolase
MKTPRFALFLFASLAHLVVAATPVARSPVPIPVILVTDIGTDIDDTWALAMILRSPELDLKFVLTDSGDTRYRAMVAAKFLETAGRSSVPVGLGFNQGPMSESDKNQAPWVTGYNLANYPGKIHEDGIAAMIALIEKSAEPITVIAVGPVPSLARAVAQAPGIAAKCRFVGMFGSFDKGYGDGPPSAESNVKVDPAALRQVLAAPWRDLLLTPLDTCGLVQLTGTNYHAIWCATGDPMLRGLIEGYCIFAPRVTWMKCDFFATRSTTLFDCVAVYLAYAEGLVDTATVQFEITDDGFTRRSAHGPFKARVALSWKDLPAFEAHLTQRLLGR